MSILSPELSDLANNNRMILVLGDVQLSRKRVGDTACIHQAHIQVEVVRETIVEAMANPPLLHHAGELIDHVKFRRTDLVGVRTTTWQNRVSLPNRKTAAMLSGKHSTRNANIIHAVGPIIHVELGWLECKRVGTLL